MPDINSEDCTHWPLPDTSRSSSAVRMPSAAYRPALTSRLPRRCASGLARMAGDRHQAAHALGDLIEARPLEVGAVLAETGDAGEDYLLIDRLSAS